MRERKTKKIRMGICLAVIWFAGFIFGAASLPVYGSVRTVEEAQTESLEGETSAEETTEEETEEETSGEETSEEETAGEGTSEEETAGEETTEEETTEEETSGEETEEPELSKTELTLKIGAKKTLSVKNLPVDVTVDSWSSSDTQVVSVSSKGKLTAKRSGTAEITAELTDGTCLVCEVAVPELKISYTSYTLVKDSTKKLKVSNAGADAVWTSSKPEIASVAKDGTVKALACGKTTIKAKVGYTKVSCVVTVVDPTLSETSLLLQKGHSYSLSVSQCTGTKKWSSGNSSVAKVSSKGVIQAKKNGKTKISVKVNGVTRTCQVQVISLRFDRYSDEISQGSSTKLKLTGWSGDGSWTSSDESMMTVSSKGKCKALKTGEVTVTYTAGQASVSCTFTVEKKGIHKTISATVAQVNNGITSLRNHILGSASSYRFLQGSCTDGTYGYYILGDKYYRPYCAIIKIRLSDGKFIRARTGLKLYHGNDMTYDKKRNVLVVAHGDGHAKGISWVSTSSLKIKKNLTLDSEINSIAYNEKKNQYVTGIRGKNQIQIRDSSGTVIRTFGTLSLKSYTRQGLDCDSSRIYVLQSALSSGKNRILIYDWKGNYITQVIISAKLESESLFHVGKKFYIAYNDSSYRGGTLYETYLGYYYQVRYKANGGSGTIAAKTVKTGKGLRLAANTFQKDGYRFLGFKAYRTSDGAAYYWNPKTKKAGWYKLGKQPDGYERYLFDGKEKTGVLSRTAGDCVTMTAVWEKIQTSQGK